MKKRLQNLKKILPKIAAFTLLILFTMNVNAQSNPVAPAYGFNIFTLNNVYIGPADVEGGFAAGGNFTFNQSAYAGSASGVGPVYGTVGSVKYAAVVGGSINWSGSASSFNFNINNSGALVKFGNLNGGVYSSNKISSGSKSIQLNGSTQSSTSAFQQTGIIDFATQFSLLNSNATCMASKTATLPAPTAGATSYTANLANGVNVLNITGSQLNALTEFNVTNASSSRILIVNVDAAGSFTMNNINMNFGPSAPYVLWNFYNTTTLSVSRLVGTLFAPGADVTKPLNANNIDGQVIAKSFTQLSGRVDIAAFVGSITCAALPVTLIAFEAKTQSCTAMISWKSGTESDFSHYLVERSSDGGTFSSLGQPVQAKGTGSTYSYTDVSPLKGSNYYRLKMVDVDGKYSYSNVRKVNLDCGRTIVMQPTITPNYTVVSGVSNTQQINVLGWDGKVIEKRQVSQPQERLELGNLPSGTYLVVVTDGNQKVFTGKVVKQ